MGRSPPNLTPEALQVLEEHDWPGNVRQFEAAVLRMLVSSSPGASLGGEDARHVLPAHLEGSLFPRGLFAGRSLRDLRDELDMAYLTHLFQETRGDIQAMVSELGVTRATLYRWLKRLRMDPDELRQGL